MKKGLFFIPTFLFLCGCGGDVKQTYVTYDPFSQSCFITEKLTIYNSRYIIEDKNSNIIYLGSNYLVTKINEKTLTINDVKKLFNISTECHDLR